MAAEGEEPSEGLEDLLDDLDTFFAPGEKRDEGQGREPPGSAIAHRRSHGSGAAGRSQEDASLDEEILPPDWSSEVADLEAPPEPIGPPGGAASGEASGGWSGEPTAEMSGRDWVRLRDVGGNEEEEEGQFEFLAEAAAGSEGGNVYGFEEEDKASSSSGFPEPTAAPDGGPEGPVPDTPEERPAEESPALTPDQRAIADVEAAAEKLAREFGEAPVSEPSREAGPPKVRVEPEPMIGPPAWEEPASRPLSGEPPPPEDRRNLPAAVLTAVVLVVAGLLLVAISKVAFAVLAGAVVLLAQAELYATVQRRGYQPATALGLVMGGMVLAGAYFKGERAMLFFLALSLTLAFLWYMVAPAKAREGALGNIAVTMLGVAYAPFMAAYVLLILVLPTSGRGLMLAVLGLTFLYDVAAFVIGSGWGKRPLAPTISPRKTWEGLIGATLVTLAAAAGILPSAVKIMTLGRAIWLFAMVAVFAPLGDLAESALKRDLGVKDMGSILPGHGGALDRIDSVLLVAPAAFYLFKLIL